MGDLGWLTQSNIRYTSSGVGKLKNREIDAPSGSVLGLKSHIAETRVGVEQGTALSRPLKRGRFGDNVIDKNAGVSERNQRDEAARLEGAKGFARVRERMEAKSKLYDQLSGE